MMKEYEVLHDGLIIWDGEAEDEEEARELAVVELEIREVRK